MNISNNETQRDSARRLELFGINEEVLRGKTLLDLGSHTGAMIFEAQKFKPSQSLGVEYDEDKVEIANRIAAYCGLNNVKFICKNIDKLKSQDISGKFDIVFCLAIEAHVKNKESLYRLLNKVTNEEVYFEGNSTTDIDSVKSLLSDNGFKSVEMLGLSDDDSRREHTPRPILKAKK